MKKYEIIVMGRLTLELLMKAKIEFRNKDFDLVVFLSYSNYTVPLGSKFNFIEISDVTYICDATLMYVTQQFSLPFDVIPEGWKTVAFFKLTKTEDFIKLIPFNTGWLPIDIKIKIGYDEKYA